MRRQGFISKLLTWTTIWVMVLCVIMPVPVAAAYTETGRTVTSQPVSPGVKVETYKLQTDGGPLNIYVTVVDLTNPYVKLDIVAGSKGQLTTARSVTNLAKEAGAVAAVNGDFFQMDEKAPIGLTVQSGQLVTSPAQRKDMYGFALTADNRPVFKIFAFSGTVTSPTGVQHPLAGVNKPTYLISQGVRSDTNTLNMFTPKWGAKSRGTLPGLPGMVEMFVRGDVVTEIRTDMPGLPIPQDGYILAGHGPAGQYLTANFKQGDVVQTGYSVSPETDNIGVAVGGQALLVHDGKRHWFTQNITGNKARTAVGASQDGQTLYLVVAEGGNSSRGMTQEELADFLVSIGVWTAVNLDGGGSSTMVARQLGEQNASLVNYPALGSERAVPNGIGVFSTAPAGALAGLKISGPRLILVGSKKPFTAKGYDEYYNPFSVDSGSTRWEISPGLGSFAGNVFSAAYGGDAVIRAVYGGVTADYSVKVLGSSDIAKVEVTPAAISLNPGETVNFSVKVTTKQGGVFVLQPGEYDVQVNGDIGTVNGTKFTASDKMGSGELVIKIDSTNSVVKITVGGIETPFYGFEAARNVGFKGYPADQTAGSFRFTRVDEPTFRGAGAARLEYDFTGSTKTRAAYGSFDGGLGLPGQPLGMGLWIQGDGGNGHWLRARITDSAGTERLVDLARNVDWKGWKHVTANIPQDLKFPVVLTDLYLVETDGGPQDKGVIYFDELSLKVIPAQDNPRTQPVEALSAEAEVEPGVPVTVQLSPEQSFVFENPAGAPVCKISARQLWDTKLATPGYDPLMPLVTVTGMVNGDEETGLPAPMTIRFKVRAEESDRLHLVRWDETGSSWQPVPFRLDKASGTVTAKTSRLGTFGVMKYVRPLPVFIDTGSNWARDLIGEMAAKRIVSGYPEGKFFPDKGVTRAEFITLMANAMGWSAETTEVGFKDRLPSWARGSISAAVSRGVVKGYSDGTFKPDKVITRAEMAVMIDKALELPDSNQPSRYQDARDIASWAVQSIRDTKVAGVMMGSSNRFRPKDVANRAEAAAVMAKVLDYYLSQEVKFN